MRSRKMWRVVTLLLAFSLFPAGAPAALRYFEHGPTEGHLLGSGDFGNIELVGRLDLAEHFGAEGFNAAADTGSVFAWDAGDSAYVAE